MTPLALRLQLLVKWLILLLILKVVSAVVFGYVDYFPPNFQASFLQGREAYFYGSYQYAFYPHLIGGPLAIVLGLLLLNAQLRRRYPAWHRLGGRIQVVNVLGVVVPSGLWVALYPSSGFWAGVGLGVLALLTGYAVAQGWRMAVLRRFAEHRRWMLRCQFLLCSAVVIRILGGLGTVLGVELEMFNLIIVWLSWVPSLLLLEFSFRHRRRSLNTT